MSGCDWPPDWPPPNSPDWRPLYPDAVLWERFTSAETGCDWLYVVLVSGDLPSIQEEVIEGRVVRRPLGCWVKIDFKVSFPIYALHDIEITLGLKSLHAGKIFVSWSKLGRLYDELTVAQPEPAAQSESVEPRAPITPPETAAPRGEQLPPAYVAKKAKKAKRPPPARGEPKKQARKAQLPTLRRLMIVHILCDEFSDDFSDDDIAGKTGVVRGHWEVECKAPLGDASRRVTYALPDRKTVRTTIRDYVARSETYLKYLKPR